MVSVLILISDDPCLQALQGGPWAASLIPSLTLIVLADVSLLTHGLIYVRRDPWILTVQRVITSCDLCLFDAQIWPIDAPLPRLLCWS